VITGTADLAALSAAASTIEAWITAEVELGDVECFQLVTEMRSTARESVLPPALHPTVPPSLTIQAWNVATSPWGPFSFVHTRVSCRSGARARGFTTAAVASTAEAAKGLATGFGYPCRVADVHLRRTYVGVELATDGLQATAVDPDPLGAGDVQYTTTMNLAHTPAGLRLVQVDAQRDVDRVERVRGRTFTFDAQRWGNPLLAPWHTISASIAVGAITLRPTRFICRPDVLAFSGAESVEPGPPRAEACR
jgi:hypothetical protein